MASLGNYILEVNPPDIVDHYSSVRRIVLSHDPGSLNSIHVWLEQYIGDVLKWGFTISGSTQMSGIFFRDGKLIQRMQGSANSFTETFHTSSTTNLPLVDPVRMEMGPSYDPQRSLQLEDYELSVYDIGSSQSDFQVLSSYISEYFNHD
jgi:hypothetical protein